MNIVYSPVFNSTSYVNLEQRQGQWLGLKVCGSAELLSELELRAGIAVPDQSEPERLVAFHASVKNKVAGTVFEQSFRTDEVGVTRQLMTWCDNLLIAGWDPAAPAPSDKLAALAEIAKGVQGKHVARRWQDLTASLRDHAVFSKDDVIEVHTAELIPPVIKAALVQLSSQATVNYVTNEGTTPSDVSVYHFKTRTQAYQWYLSWPEALADVDVTVSADNCILNDMALSMGRPAVNSKSQNSNPQLLQLFKLGLSLFARPLNVYNLLSYLQVPGNPLGGVAYKLAQVLADEGGINEKWQEVITNYDFTDDEGKDRRDDKLAFIAMINADYSPDRIPVADVRTYTGKLAHWCDLLRYSRHVDDERKEQLVVLAAFCRSLLAILPFEGFITSGELKSHVDGIYRPQSFTHMKAQKDSPDVISDVTQLADRADKVCWLGCVGGSVQPYPFDFLNQTEYEDLNRSGILIPAKSGFYTLHHRLQLEALKNISHLILVTWEFDGNARQEEHPLVTELRQQRKADWHTLFHADEQPNLPTVSGDVSTLEPQTSYQLSSMAALRRDKESFSSVSLLIQHPFDYTMDYLLRLREPIVGQLPDLDTTKGLVAHLVVETLVKEHGEQMADYYLSLDAAARDELFNAAIAQKGAILMLPEYHIECQQFKAVLHDSLTALARTIKDLCLKPVGSEVELNVSFEKIGNFQAKIDLLLRDAAGRYVIFDMKWSEKNSYREYLEENKAMQLELYRQAVEQQFDAGVAGVGYYLFPRMTLFTTDYPDSDHVKQVTVKADEAVRNLFAEVQNSYVYRRTSLDGGFIEDGELTPIEDLEYTKASTADQPLYPIKADYNDKDKSKKRKACPYVKKDKPPFTKQKPDWKKPTDPKEIKTTHPILKGRLV